MDEGLNPLEERPFVGELGDTLRSAVGQVRAAPPPAGSMTRALERARRMGPGKVNPWLRYNRIATAAAVAAVLLLAFSLLLVSWRFEPNGRPAPGDSGVAASRPADGGDRSADHDLVVGVGHVDGGIGHSVAGGDFLMPERAPISTFPLHVDATAYRDVRRALLEENRLPAPDAVRVADLINSFSYSYPEPSGGDAASLTLDLAECPWDGSHLLARIGVRARSSAAALDVRVQVVFNPRRVAAYRLIGGDGRRGDAAESGETLSPGQSVTALYEITATERTDHGEWLTAEFRCRDRTGHGNTVARALLGPPRGFADAPDDFRFAAAAAEFGLLLRDRTPHHDRYAAVRATAGAALGADPDGRRAEFLTLVNAADRLTLAHKLTRTRKTGIG